MKKWMITYLAIFLFVCICGIGIETCQLKNAGSFTKVADGESKFCQGATLGDRTYIMIWGDGDEKTVRIDKGQKNFELLDMVVVDSKDVYYQYQFTDKKGSRSYGLGKIGLEKYKNEILETWKDSGEDWFAFGYNKENKQLVYETESDAEGEILEYKKALPWGEGAWAKVEKTEALATISQRASNVSAEVFERAEGEWTKICIKGAIARLLFIFIVLGVLIGVILNGILGEYSVLRRMFSLLQLVVLVGALALFGFVAFFGVKDAMTQQNEAIVSNINYLLSQMPAETELTDESLEKLRAMNDKVLAEVATVSVKDGKVGEYTSSNLVDDDSEKVDVSTSAVSLVKDAGEGTTPVDGLIGYHDKTTEAIAMTDLYHTQSGGVILAIIDPTYWRSQVEASAMGIFKIVFPIYLVLALLLLGVEVLYVTRWREFVDAATDIVIKDKPVNEHEDAEQRFRGFGLLWKLILQMNHTVKDSVYRMEKGIKFGNRFVPNGLERLFKKEKIVDLMNGEQIVRKGDMAWVSIGSIRNMLAIDYAEEVSELFKMVKDAQEENDGTWIHYDSDFDKNKVFFNNDGVLDFAVQVIQDMERNTVLEDVAKLILIHKDNYRFGIAGTDDKVFAYAFSDRDDQMDEFLADLRTIGARIVLTEEVYEANKEFFTFRYIGFVTSKITGEEMKLYECLDAFEDEKRRRFVRTAVQFDQALEFFYSRDFYLARSTFNEVIQQNPEDEIARQYLFKCENHLNLENTDTHAFELF